MSNTPELDYLPHAHICTVCEKQYECEEEGCEETDDTAICEDCNDYEDGFPLGDDNDFDDQ